MRLVTVVLTAMALMLVAGWADAGKSVREPGEGFIRQKHPKLGKDYYVVRQGESNQCNIISGEFGDKPVGAVGDAPYANKEYAIAALKSAPECKGGLADEGTDQKKHRAK